MKEVICKLLNISTASYYRWKKDKVPIIEFLEKYFTKDELEEFIKNKDIYLFSKIDSSINYRLNRIEENLKKQSNDINNLLERCKKSNNIPYHRDKDGKPSVKY